jgi:hypothetical protein
MISLATRISHTTCTTMALSRITTADGLVVVSLAFASEPSTS